MQWYLLVLLIVYGIEARSRLHIDDRIVFPTDNQYNQDRYPDSKPKTSTETSTETSTTRSTIVSTTTENLTMGSTILSNSSEMIQMTTSSHRPLTDEQMNSTELTGIDNRILFETLPKCKAGYELRANRCRKSA